MFANYAMVEKSVLLCDLANFIETEYSDSVQMGHTCSYFDVLVGSRSQIILNSPTCLTY